MTRVPERALRELGRTEGTAETLDLLVRDQHTRRMLLLRAVLDAAEEAPTAVRPTAAAHRLRDDWALLETAERAGQGRTVRTLLLRPLVGPWAQRALSGLTGTAPARGLDGDLAHFSALAAAAAVRAGVPFTVRLTATDGLLALPTLGALRTGATGPVSVEATHKEGVLTLRRRDASPVTVRPQTGHGAWSSSAAWAPAHSLPGLLAHTGPVPLDDLDPYRGVRDEAKYHALSGVTTLDDTARKRWLQAWTGTAELLRLGGEHRAEEAGTLLRSLVPLATPSGSGPAERPSGSCSGTRREAFGAVLSSVPPSAAGFAAMLVHELQHTKLAALCALVPLHHAGPEARHFAPWRPDPRPFDGLWQGAYSHLALADWWQRYALAAPYGPERDHAWAEHTRCREQVGAALPALVGSDELTPAGRRFADSMVGAYTRVTRIDPPAGHLARAAAYVSTAKSLWRQRHGTMP